MRFDSLGLHPDILKGVNDAGFEHCTAIQEQSYPECLAGKDVIAQSQTGSGKTAVFLLTVFSRVMASGPDASGKPKALVMVPTRELATQVVDDAVKLGRHLPLKSVAIYGGVEYDKQLNALKSGVDLVVATPGRMIDLYKSKALSLDSIEIFVIDEADRMFDMGFAPDIIYIAGKLPKGRPRQTMLFSATIDENVRRLASRYMLPDPVMIEIEPEQVTVNTIDQKIIYVSNEEKLPVLLTLLKRPEVERAIVFTNMKSTAERLGWKLAANGLSAKVLTGDVTQERRQKIIDGIKAGNINILVASDVAARGLHIEAVSHVINYDLPDDAANYVHRIGRTARAGKSGKAYSLVCEDHVLNLPQIEKYIERKLESEWIEDSEMAKDAAPREKAGAKKTFERRERKPDAGRGRGRQGSEVSKDGRRRPPHTEKKQENKPESKIGHAPAAKPALHRGALAGPHKKHPPHALKKETAHGARPEKSRHARHGADRRPEHNKPRPHHAPAPVAVKREEKPHPHAVERGEAAPKEKKPGILKRLLKFIKKK